MSTIMIKGSYSNYNDAYSEVPRHRSQDTILVYRRICMSGRLATAGPIKVG